MDSRVTTGEPSSAATATRRVIGLLTAAFTLGLICAAPAPASGPFPPHSIAFTSAPGAQTDAGGAAYGPTRPPAEAGRDRPGLVDHDCRSETTPDAGVPTRAAAEDYEFPHSRPAAVTRARAAAPARIFDARGPPRLR
jgi:hypothetical protein